MAGPPARGVPDFVGALETDAVHAAEAQLVAQQDAAHERVLVGQGAGPLGESVGGVAPVRRDGRPQLGQIDLDAECGELTGDDLLGRVHPGPDLVVAG